jgi:hypothetical protein
MTAAAVPATATTVASTTAATTVVSAASTAIEAGSGTSAATTASTGIPGSRISRRGVISRRLIGSLIAGPLVVRSLVIWSRPLLDHGRADMHRLAAVAREGALAGREIIVGRSAGTAVLDAAPSTARSRATLYRLPLR